GGLVSRYFLEVLGGWRNTRALVTFGTPYRGAINALDTLANGSRKGPFGLLDLSELVRSFTAVYQLLPIYPCYDGGDGRLVRVGETAGIPNLDATMAKAALAFHREIEEAVKRNSADPEYQANRYALKPIVGIGQETAQSGRLRGSGVEILRALVGKDLSGDGTVPRVSATPIELAGDAGAMFAATKHAALQNAEAVGVHLEGVLSGLSIDLGRFRKPKPAVSLGVDDVYWAGEPILIRARCERADAELTATIRSAQDEPLGAAVLGERPDGWRAAEFRLPRAGAYRVEVTGQGVEPAADIFAVATAAGVELPAAAAPPPPPRSAPPPPAPSPAPPPPAAAERSWWPFPPLGGKRSGKRSKPPAGGAPPPAPPPPPAAPSPPVATAPAPPAAALKTTISAEAPEQATVGTIVLIDYRLELSGADAAPLRERIEADVRPEETIRVILTTHGTAVQAQGSRIQEVQPPSPGNPVQGVFEVRAVEVATCQLALIFRQGGTELGSIRLPLEVVAGAPRAGTSQGVAAAAPRMPEDDELLVLLIQQETERVVVHNAGQPANEVVTKVWYEYQLQSDQLGLNYVTLTSRPLQDRGGSVARTAQAYVESIYERVTQDVLSPADMQRLEKQVAALGATMCGELFDPEVTRELWKVRPRLRAIQVTSWEPYIPWELVRLKHPDTGEVDERFLCEYGLVRALPGESGPRSLRLDKWAYLAATYPNGSAETVAGEVDYFTKTLPSRGIRPTTVAATYIGFLSALEAPDFDVLHLACHGESQHQKIEDAVLQIGDELDLTGRAQFIAVDATTVRQSAQLRKRRPLVFLNACESGRHGPSLTAWGGWPTAFLGAGAGAFVGTSWPVRDQPASKFAHAFYDALQQGDTLAAAATVARRATRGVGDASWLAFKVYGHPRARHATT
ncbi:MAG TPA: CHAT domain-containing protein, partial [Gemmatimonadales bacterium]|nr:CHAT domain-containing protein [Gemmatimonadales bacterium]